MSITRHCNTETHEELPFKQLHTLEKRKQESARIREKYPDRIPVIVERASTSDFPDIDKKKYLCPSDLTVGQFMLVIRKRVQLTPEKAMYVFVNNVLPPTNSLMSSLYEGQKDEDGFLYLSYSGENYFGGKCMTDEDYFGGGDAQNHPIASRAVRHTMPTAPLSCFQMLRLCAASNDMTIGNSIACLLGVWDGSVAWARDTHELQLML